MLRLEYKIFFPSVLFHAKRKKIKNRLKQKRTNRSKWMKRKTDCKTCSHFRHTQNERILWRDNMIPNGIRFQFAVKQITSISSINKIEFTVRIYFTSNEKEKPFRFENSATAGRVRALTTIRKYPFGFGFCCSATYFIMFFVPIFLRARFCGASTMLLSGSLSLSSFLPCL